MIRHLSAEAFGRYGKILPGKKGSQIQVNHHSLPLEAGSVCNYQTVARTWLCWESGLVILSVSDNGAEFVDFYLDKPVWLERGIWFSLSAFQGRASVQMAGVSLPLQLQTGPAHTGFLVRPQLQVKCLYTLFCQEKEQGFLDPGKANTMAEMVYVDQGSIHSVADGKEYILEQGDLILYAPGQWRMQYADVGVAPRLITLTFDVTGQLLPQVFNRVFRSHQRAIGLLQTMLREQERSESGCADMILSLLTALLVLLQREESSPAERIQSAHSVNNENEIVSRAQQYIARHVADKLSVPAVAAGIDVSASYLTALFHKHLQISPGEYIRRIKLQESKRMIREGEGNLTYIAQTLQYSTIHHFSRQFKEKFGITPSEYAKSVR